MFQAITTNPGDCIDNDYLQNAFANLEDIRVRSNINTEQFVCKRIDETVSGLVTRQPSELCIDIQNLSGLINPNTTSDDELKILFFNIQASTTYNISDGDNAGTVRIVRSAKIKCDGETVRTLAGAEFSAPIISAPFECASNAKIELCFENELRISGQATFPTGQTTIRVCGALVCISDVINNQTPGYFLPPVNDPACRYGREALHLIVQNIAALRNKFATFGQQPGCIDYRFDDEDDHTLLNEVPTQTEFLILGFLKICGQNSNTDTEAIISATPKFLCGATEYECLSSDLVLPGTDGDGPTGGCITLPIVMCGTCQPGDSLVSSVRSQFDCDENPTQSITGFNSGITEVEQHYCLFSYASIDVDLGEEVASSIGKCINIDMIQGINANFDSLDKIANEQTPVSVSVQQRRGVSQDVVPIVPAQPWPPIDDPTNTDPPPIPKHFLILNVFPFRESLAGANLEDVRIVEATVEVVCGSDVILTESVRWQITGSGGSNVNGPALQIFECIECPIDRIVFVRFSGSTISGFGYEPDNFRYEIKVYSL